MAFAEQQTYKVNTGAIFAALFVFVCLLLMLPYQLSRQSEENSTLLGAQYYADQSFVAEVQDILDLDERTWKPVQNFNLGLVKRPHWLKLTIPPSERNKPRVLFLNYGLLDHLDIWFLSDDASGNQVLAAYKTGDAYVFDQRIIKLDKFLFKVPAYDQDLTVLIRGASKGPLKLPVELWYETSFIEYDGLSKLFLGVFFGYMFAMGLSNLFIYASTRNKIFAVYSGYIFSIGMTVASLQGLGFQYIWPNNIWLQEIAVPVFTCMTVAFITSLTIQLLDLKKASPKIYRTLRNIRYLYFLLLALCFVLPYEVIIKALLTLLVLTTPLIFATGLILAIKGSMVARYFCAAWGVLFASGLSIAVESFGVLELPIEPSYLVMVGALTEALLLALALAISFSEQLANASRTRTLALKNEQAALLAKDELIRLQEKNQSDLEYSIEERTLELEIALRELGEKNRELEKLSAIDPLTGLMNRRYFDKRLLAETRRSKRELTPLGLAMLDIDYFKKVNDTYGHLCGDHCLKVFAEVLKEYIRRPSDVISRYGGEEFVLILPNTDQDGLAKLLEEIRKGVEAKKILYEGKELSITVSVGACSRIIASEDEQALLVAFVDKKLYEAKHSGRNRVTLGTY